MDRLGETSKNLGDSRCLDQDSNRVTRKRNSNYFRMTHVGRYDDCDVEGADRYCFYKGLIDDSCMYWILKYGYHISL